MNIKLKLFFYLILISVSSLGFAQVESDPPTLTSFSMDKTSIDVGESDQIVRFTVEAEDESGVDWSNPDTKMELRDPSGKAYYINFSVEAPHVASYTFSSDSKSGLWRVGYIRLIDTLDNRISFDASSLGSNTSVEITGLDTDLDSIVDCDDNDDDGDTVLDVNDAFPLDATETIDTDSDGIGNNADTDDDGDGVIDSNDAYPLISLNGLTDTDLDGLPNDCDAACLDAGMTADTDDDGDGVSDNDDAFPLDATETEDSDLDGVGDNSDPFPNDALYSIDSDSDGMPDEWETRYGLDPNDASDATSDQDNDGVSALDEFLAGTIPSGSLDIDGNEDYDALTDGLLLLRGMFGLDGSALVTGTIASDAAYTESADIESRIAILGDLADIDGNGQIDALTDGLLTLRYLFGLEGDTLINGVVASDATRTSAEQIEAHLKTLMPAL